MKRISAKRIVTTIVLTLAYSISINANADIEKQPNRLKISNTETTTRIKLSQSDLKTQEKRDLLKKHITKAAQQVCSNAKSLDPLYNYRSCVKSSIEEAEKQIPLNPIVAATH